MKVFSGLREDIRSLMDEMGHEPETSLEQESVCPDTDIFLLTHENIKALKLLLSQVGRVQFRKGLMMRYKSLLQLLLRDKMYLEQPHVHGLSCPVQLEMKKESLISSRDKLKDRATSLWNRLSCPDEEAGEFKQKPLSTLCDDIKRV